jgi:uncharacterized protein (DUF1778 family)
MPKTITIRLDNETYELFRYAALGNKRTISNYIEFAALNYTLNDQLVSYEEMEEIRPMLNTTPTTRVSV